VNRPIVRLFGLVVLLFALLVAFTSRWTIFEAKALRENPLNARSLLEQQRVARGEIVAADGTVLARSLKREEGIYERTYPTGSLFANTIGYYFTNLGSSGLERYRSSELNGQTPSNLQRILDELQGKKQLGEKVVTSLDPAAQRVAVNALAGHHGAVVALEPASGSVTVMASSPPYDANALASASGYAKLAHENEEKPLVNRAVQFGYAPGSTFKIVTATAAIDTGDYTPQSVLSGRNEILISGKPLKNDENESLGQISLTEALARSVNTVWAQVAVHLGKATMARYMERFGFDRKPELDYPAGEMSASGEHEGERIVPPRSERVDVGRMGIGQDKLEVTPLQMAEVAAAVADGGKLMVPHLTSRVVNAEGQTVKRIEPKVQSVVMKPSTAAAVRGMMEAVVNEGTGVSAQIPGIQVAGKTGTAETQIGATINNVWFIAFAPASAPKVAIAVTLEKVPGQGAAFAAPVAREVIEKLLHD
jgi:peptidoglycan glycosyltransferase